MSPLTEVISQKICEIKCEDFHTVQTAMSLITSKAWLDPILPDALPPSIIALADALPRKTQFLAGRLPPAACRLPPAA
ncbi:hypothetical protein ACYZUD_11585 [Pseudomonas sp. XS1P51]